MAPVEACATVFVVKVPTTAIPGVAGWQRERRRLRREKPALAKLQCGLAATRARLDAHGMIGIQDVVRLHRAPGKLHLSLNTLAEQPR